MSKWQKQGLIPYSKSYVSWLEIQRHIKECDKQGYEIVKVLKLYENGKKYGKVIVRA